MKVFAGIDIGGTKCAVSLGRLSTGEDIEQEPERAVFPTP